MTEILEAREVQPVDEPESESGSSTPTGPMLFRSADVLQVRFPERLVEVIAHPYEQEALVNWEGRAVTEVCARGAYSGIQRRADRIHVNRDHDVTRPVGKVKALHPNRTEGLVTDIVISHTALGEETLELAADGVLKASVGFRPKDEPGSHVWSRDRRQVRLVKCWLGHVALVAEPAYEGAEVMTVRAAPIVVREPEPVSATPILDRILAERMAAQYGIDLT